MEKKKIFAALLGVGLAIGTPWQGFAQEKVPAQQSATPPQAVTDGGVEAVREAQATEVPEITREDAASVLEKLLKKKGWVRGWDEKKKRFIAIGVANIPQRISNPSRTKDLYRLRRFAATEAVLNAKAQIITFVKQELSAEQQILIPGTDLHKKFETEVENLMDQINRQKEIVANLYKRKDQSYAERLRGATLGDRLDELMVAAIKKLDKEYTGKERDQELAKRYQEAVKRYKAEYAHYQELVKRAKVARKDVVETHRNSVKSMAAMPLFGATAIMQTESWDEDGTYQIAVMVVWSNVLERAARAIATGKPYKIKNSGSKKALSVHEWIDKQDLAVMIGPRQYIDKDGVRWFLGIGAENVSRRLHPRTRDHNKNTAQLNAMNAAAFSVMGDYNMQTASEEILKVYSAGKDANGEEDFTANTASTLRKSLEAKIQKHILRGGQVLMNKSVKHPITGDDIFVVVYAFNPNHVAAALAMWTRNYVTKEQSLRYQTEERGRQANVDEKIRNATNDPKDFQRGYNKQNKRYNKELQRRRPKQQAPKGTRVYHKGKQQTAPAKSTAGSFSGDVDVSDDF